MKSTTLALALLVLVAVAFGAPSSPISEAQPRADAPAIFSYDYEGNAADWRDWQRVDASTWRERSPQGRTTTFRDTGPRVVDGQPGVVVVRLPPADMEVFIPNRGVVPARLQYRDLPNGRWTYLGELHDGVSHRAANRFAYLYMGDPAQRMEFTQVDAATWRETTPNGRTTDFRVTGRRSVEGRDGTVILRLPGADMEIFIPDPGGSPRTLRVRDVPDGRWRLLGAMIVP